MNPLIEYPRKEGTPVSFRPFSPAVKVGELIFVSGQASVDLQGNIVPDTFDGEFRRSMENLKKVVEDSGSDMKHVIQTRNYIRDADNVVRFNELYREYFSAPFPSRTTITGCLKGLHYEVECIAVVKR